MNKDLKDAIKVGLICAAASLLTSLLHQRGCRHTEQPQTIEVIRTDTLTITKPIEVHDTIYKYVYAKLPVLQSDKEQYVPPNPRIEKTQITQTNPTEAKKPTGFSSFSDSVLVEIPITQKEYADTNYRAWVSGFMPNLDSIRIYQRTIERTTTPKPTRLHITLGVGAAFNGRVEPAVFVGIGWSIYDIRLR